MSTTDDNERFEDQLARLEEIVARLEDDSVGLILIPGSCIATMSDPRVSGVMDNDLQEVCFGEAGGA